jgi:catechol 2,3-dioxygenase-like lactoylglutathione lyase family enzyme
VRAINFITKSILQTIAISALGMALPAHAADAPAMPPLKHFMVAISVADLKAETDWYVEKLGFKIEKDVNIGDGRVFFRWLTLGDQRIELVYSPTAKDATPARPKPPGHAGLHGFTHVTLETHDLAATKAALAARGVTPALDVTEVAPLGIKVIYLTDPEGNAVEIAQRLKH